MQMMNPVSPLDKQVFQMQCLLCKNTFKFDFTSPRKATLCHCEQGNCHDLEIEIKRSSLTRLLQNQSKYDNIHCLQGTERKVKEWVKVCEESGKIPMSKPVIECTGEFNNYCYYNIL